MLWMSAAPAAGGAVWAPWLSVMPTGPLEQLRGAVVSAAATAAPASAHTSPADAAAHGEPSAGAHAGLTSRTSPRPWTAAGFGFGLGLGFTANPTEAKAGRRAGEADLVVQVQVEPECDGVEVPLRHHLRQSGLGLGLGFTATPPRPKPAGALCEADLVVQVQVEPDSAMALRVPPLPPPAPVRARY